MRATRRDSRRSIYTYATPRQPTSATEGKDFSKFRAARRCDLRLWPRFSDSVARLIVACSRVPRIASMRVPPLRLPEIPIRDSGDRDAHVPDKSPLSRRSEKRAREKRERRTRSKKCLHGCWRGNVTTRRARTREHDKFKQVQVPCAFKCLLANSRLGACAARAARFL